MQTQIIGLTYPKLTADTSYFTSYLGKKTKANQKENDQEEEPNGQHLTSQQEDARVFNLFKNIISKYSQHYALCRLCPYTGSISTFPP